MIVLNKIHHQFTLLVLVLIIMAMGVISWFSFHVTEQAVIANATIGMTHALANVLREEKYFHKKAENAIRFALDAPAFKEYFSLQESRAPNRYNANGTLVLTEAQLELKRKIDQRTDAVQKLFPIAETCVIDASGQEHSRTTHGVIAPIEEFSPAESDAPFFTPTFALPHGGIHLTYPYMSADALEWVFAYTTPIHLDDGTIPAIYHLEIPVTHFQQILTLPNEQKTTPANSNRMFILDPSGRLIADNRTTISLDIKPGTDPEQGQLLENYLPSVEQVSRTPEFLKIISRSKTEEHGEGRFEEDDETFFVAFERMPHFNWSLVTIKSYHTLLEGSSLSTIKQVILLTSLAIALLAGMGVWYFSHRITRPIVQIITAMQELQHGDKTTEIPVIGHNEVAFMAKVFNQMSREILNSQAHLQQERNKLTTIILSAREGIVVTNQENQVVLVNPAAERLLDKSSEELCNDGFLNIVDDPFYVQSFLSQGGVDLPNVLVYKSRVLNFFAATIRDDEGLPIGSAALIRDVTEEKNLEQQLRTLSYTDQLTGLFNRRYLETILVKEFDRSNRYNTELSLLFFDVDHFKKFNDQHGHEMGDAVLSNLGALAKDFFRKPDHACRYGGEEFCVLLPNTNADGALAVAERFRKSVESTQVHDLWVTISIGCATMSNCQPKLPSELLKAADLALYEGKKLGRNRVVRWEDLPMAKTKTTHPSSAG